MNLPQLSKCHTLNTLLEDFRNMRLFTEVASQEENLEDEEDNLRCFLTRG